MIKEIHVFQSTFISFQTNNNMGFLLSLFFRSLYQTLQIPVLYILKKESLLAVAKLGYKIMWQSN